MNRVLPISQKVSTFAANFWLSDNYKKEIAGSLKYQWLGRFDFILNVNWLKLNENIKKKNISRYQRVGKEIGDKDK